MSKLIYSRNGSATTESIDNASPTVRAIWNQAHRFGANIVRVEQKRIDLVLTQVVLLILFIMEKYQSTSKKIKCMRVMPYTLLERYLLLK